MKATERAKCIRIAKKIRRWAVKYRKIGYFPDDLEGMCGIAAVALMRALERHGMQARIGLSNCHAYVIYKGYVLDVTATQFGKAPVVCRRQRDIYIEEDWWTTRREFKSYEDFIASQQDWAEGQIFNDQWEKRYAKIA